MLSRKQRPTLVLAHNKTLAAQLYLNSNNSFQTMRWNILFYYDYYQPEAFMPVTEFY
jgi:excinuclease ABC subunit B